MKDPLFWYDFISGVCTTIYGTFAIASSLFIAWLITLKLKTDDKDIIMLLITVFLIPILLFFFVLLVPYVRSLSTKVSAPIIIKTSKGITVVPDLSNIALGDFLGIVVSSTFIICIIGLVIGFLGKK